MANNSHSDSVGQSLRKSVVDFLLLAFSEIIVQFYGSTFSTTAREYGLLGRSLCDGRETKRAAWCNKLQVSDIWCVEEACRLFK